MDLFAKAVVLGLFFGVANSDIDIPVNLKPSSNAIVDNKKTATKPAAKTQLKIKPTPAPTPDPLDLNSLLNTFLNNPEANSLADSSNSVTSPKISDTTSDKETRSDAFRNFGRAATDPLSQLFTTATNNDDDSSSPFSINFNSNDQIPGATATQSLNSNPTPLQNNFLLGNTAGNGLDQVQNPWLFTNPLQQQNTGDDDSSQQNQIPWAAANSLPQFNPGQDTTLNSLLRSPPISNTGISASIQNANQWLPFQRNSLLGNTGDDDGQSALMNLNNNLLPRLQNQNFGNMFQSRDDDLSTLNNQILNGRLQTVNPQANNFRNDDDDSSVNTLAGIRNRIGNQRSNSNLRRRIPFNTDDNDDDSTRGLAAFNNFRIPRTRNIGQRNSRRNPGIFPQLRRSDDDDSSNILSPSQFPGRNTRINFGSLNDDDDNNNNNNRFLRGQRPNQNILGRRFIGFDNDDDDNIRPFMPMPRRLPVLRRGPLPNLGFRFGFGGDDDDSNIRFFRAPRIFFPARPLLRRRFQPRRIFRPRLIFRRRRRIIL